MTENLSPDEQRLAERVAMKASRVFARFWRGEMARIEEQISDPSARWDILRAALERIARREA